MKLKKTAISTAVLVTLGLGGMALGPVASAAVLPDGNYVATINPTPLNAQFAGLIKPGTAGAWNSSFSFNHVPTYSSQGMSNNDTLLTIGTGTYGSSKLGWGAGSWDMHVTGNTFTTSNFQVDAILGTSGGTFVQYGTINGGTLNVGTSGAMTLDPTGRKGAVGAGVYDAAWNIPDSSAATENSDGNPVYHLGTTYASFTTGTSASSATLNTNQLSVGGHGITQNSDGTYNVILVSASNVGGAWGTFDSVPYVEAWNVNIAPVPIPAAAWLFGSGLIGLVGIARRKKSS